MYPRHSESERAEIVIEELKRLRDDKFKGNLTAMSRALDLTSAYLSNVVNGHRGIGLTLVAALAREKGCSVAEVLHEHEPRWSEAPGWTGIVTSARAQMPMVSDDAWEWLGSLSGSLPPGPDVGALALIALAWDQARMKVAAAPEAAQKHRRRADTPPGATAAAPKKRSA